LKIVEHGGQKIPTSFSMKSRRKKMINKIKNMANKHWHNHKVCVIIIAVLVVAYIVK